MPPLKSARAIGGQSPSPLSPFLNVVPLPSGAATHSPAGLREAETAGPPLVDSSAAHAQSLADLDDSDRFNHVAQRTQSVDSTSGCRHNTDTTRSGPGAAPTARGLATTEVPRHDER
jgi:hypothetical protein